FAFSTTYTFTVTGAEDLASNPLAATPFSWTWTTEAEPTTGTIAGSVEDEDGNPIASATVQLKNANTGNIADTETTDSNSVFEFSDVPFGSYTILVSKVGYENHETTTFTISQSTPTIEIGEIELKESAQVQKEASLSWLWIAAGPLVAIIVVLIVLLPVARRKRPAQP
ncbi:MAG: carboxypeptidase-like regulatory domain-containing protein, partial [Thermoplasmata archaeon]